MPGLIARVALGSTNATNVTTGAIDTTGANLLVMAVADANNGATVSDSKGNTWTPLTPKTTSNGAVQLFYVASPTVGSGHTFTVASGAPSIIVWAFDGLAATPFDQQNGALNASTSTGIAFGSVTPTQNGELLVFAIAAAASPTLPGFTVGDDAVLAVTDTIALVGGQHYALCGGFGAKVAKTATNRTWDYLSSGTVATVVATFKYASVGGAGGYSRGRIVNQ